MNCCLRSTLFAVLLVAGWVGCFGISAVADDEIRPATDRPQPKSPLESAKCVKLPPGFRLELVAAEPTVFHFFQLMFPFAGHFG